MAAQPEQTGAPTAYVGLELGYGQTDNLGRDASGVRSDISILGLRFLMQGDRPRLQGALVGDIEGRHYGAAAVLDSDEVVGSVDGNLAYHLVRDRFIWEFQQNYGQTRTDPLAPIGPNNRESTTVSSSGPRIRLISGARNDLELTGRLSERRYDRSDRLDSRLTSSRLEFSHELDSVSSIRFSLNSWTTDYDDVLQSSYDFQSLTAAYSKEFESGGVEVMFGPGELDNGISTDSTAVGTFAWNRGIGARSELSIWASRDYTDTGELFRLGGLPETSLVRLGDVPGSSPGLLDTQSELANTNEARLTNVTVAASPLLRSNTGAQLSLVGSSTEINFIVQLAKNRYDTDNTYDSDARTVSIGVNRDIGRRWRGDARLRVTNEEFLVTNTDNRDRALRLRVTRTLGSSTGVSIELTKMKRDRGDVPFDENVYAVSISHEYVRRR